MKCKNQTTNLFQFKINLSLFICVLLYSLFVCKSAYANVYFKTTIMKQNIKIIILIAGVPSSQALPGFLYYCASICGRSCYTWRASCVDSKPKKNSVQ